MFYRLCLLRHAHAQTIPGQPDHDRPLSETGQHSTRAIGQALVEAAVLPDLALVSTATRARATWQGVQKQLPALIPALFEQSLYNATPDDILESIQTISTAQPHASGAGATHHHCLLVLAHNPGLHQLALQLITQAGQTSLARLHDGLPPGGLVIIDFPDLPGWHALTHYQQYGGMLHRYLLPEDTR